MGKLLVLLAASAVLTAACGAAATHAGSNPPPASIAGVQVSAGPNANSSISDITNRPNPPVGQGGSSRATLPATPKAAAPVSGRPSEGSAWDRCGGGIGVDLAGNRTGSAGQKRPRPECNVQ